MFLGLGHNDFNALFVISQTVTLTVQLAIGEELVPGF